MTSDHGSIDRLLYECRDTVMDQHTGDYFCTCGSPLERTLIDGVKWRQHVADRIAALIEARLTAERDGHLLTIRGQLEAWRMENKDRKSAEAEVARLTTERDEALEAIKVVHPQSAVLYMIMAEKIREAEAEVQRLHDEIAKVAKGLYVGTIESVAIRHGIKQHLEELLIPQVQDKPEAGEDR